jgi:hypothetical protein
MEEEEEEGFRHLYKGVGIAAIRPGPSTSVFFCTYDTTKKTFSKQIDQFTYQQLRWVLLVPVK